MWWWSDGAGGWSFGSTLVFSLQPSSQARSRGPSLSKGRTNLQAHHGLSDAACSNDKEKRTDTRNSPLRGNSLLVTVTVSLLGESRITSHTPMVMGVHAHKHTCGGNAHTQLTPVPHLGSLITRHIDTHTATTRHPRPRDSLQLHAEDRGRYKHNTRFCLCGYGHDLALELGVERAL